MAGGGLPCLLSDFFAFAVFQVAADTTQAKIDSLHQTTNLESANPMNFNTQLKKALLVGCALLLTTFLPPAALGGDDDYSFKVKNTTKELISKILVSEDGEKYGFFDIGAGIKPGETVTLVWDKSTNSSSCHQWFKAVWESGEEGKPVKFDFCEKGLELEF
jgi:hypothetical protein